ncbi:phosphotransferase enzyme family protein [Kribbella deserti]|uniref:Phosphotransferase enzyme family protein n=1 Tax=Kribbella deserti TaxID=1926257 RepID=A0ABV6QNY2_9ACTN
MELVELVRAWPVGAIETVVLVAPGTNNLTYFVEASSGRFVLRLSAATPDRLAFEQALCERLTGLPFAIPMPLATIGGRPWIEIEPDGGDPDRRGLGGTRLVARLARAIPGDHPRRGDAVQAELCGRALAQLDHAMAELPPESLPPIREWNAEFTTLHPRVRSLARFFELLPADRREAAREFFDRVIQTFDGCDLPRQVIHADFGVSNVLLAGYQVTGILDLEFACPGYRAMDLAAALWSFGTDDETAKAFRRGYLAEFPLTDSELAWIPHLQRLREATSLVHRGGRHLDGHISATELDDRLNRLLTLDASLPLGGFG